MGDAQRLIKSMLDRAKHERKKVALSLLEQNSDAKILDCGCSNGEFTLEIARQIGTSDIHGIDILTENLVAAQARGIKTYQHDLNEKLPFADETFDVVHAGDIIEHLSNTDTFVKEIHRILKPGGYLVLSTNNLASLHNIVYLLFGRQPAPAAVSDEVVVGGWREPSRNIHPGPAHRRLFTPAALKGLCEHYGFQFEKSKGSGFHPFPAFLASVLTTIARNHSSHITVKLRKRHWKKSTWTRPITPRDSQITTSPVERIAATIAWEAIFEDKKTTLSLLEYNPNAVVLDCGCRDGEMTMRLARKIGTTDVHGIDILPENLVAAQARGIKTYQHDLNEGLPFADGTFDVVTASHIIEHLSATDILIKEIYRVLKVGGYAIISTPNLASFHNIIYLLLGRQPPLVKVSDEVVVGGLTGTYVKSLSGPSHRRTFTLAALKGLCEYYGLQLEKSKGSGFYPFPTLLARALTAIAKNYSSHISVKVRKYQGKSK